jgi:hypothetical protein
MAEGEAAAAGAKPRWNEGWRGGDEGDSLSMQWFKFLFPGLFGLAVAFALLLYLPWWRWLEWTGVAIAYLVFSYGKVAIIPLGVGVLHFHPLFIAWTVVFVDFECALFIAWNFPLAKRVPVLGHYISFVEGWGAKALRRNSVLAAGAWAALALYVMLPVRGTGGITAAVIGRGLGMRPLHVVSAISLGTAVTAVVLGYATYEGVALLALDLVVGTIVILIAASLALVAMLLLRLARIRRWEAEGASARTGGR